MGMGSDTIGERLRSVRKRHGLRQEDLAARVGVHPKTVSRWENNTQPPEAAALEHVAATLGVTEQWLRYGETGPEPIVTSRRGVRLPPAAYARLWGYLERLRDAGLGEEQIEEAERIMSDPRYAKLNKRNGRELSGDEWAAFVDAGWAAVWETLARAGARIPGPKPVFWEG